MTRTPADELAWLQAHPEFEERPATLTEFLGPNYLNIKARVRKRIIVELTEIMGEDVSATRPAAFPYAMMTGAIGIGKTTVSSIVLTYLAHWVLCLKDPQDFYELLAGSRIAFMQMSTSEKQVIEVVFGDIKARIKHSPWFQKYPYDPRFEKQIRFPKEVWIIPGDSAETTFEGYNILGGILDEADSHRITEKKDYAEQGFSTIESRISSRFQDRGFLMVIGQMKSKSGFAARKYEEFRGRPDAYAVSLTIWESMGRDFYLNDKGEYESFFYDPQRRQIIPKALRSLLGNEGVLEIPNLYLVNFKTNPVKALRDLAGIPPEVGDPFIALPDRIIAARDRYVLRYGNRSPVDRMGRIEEWFVAPDPLKRVCHIDIGYAEDGDALGFAMGHVREMVKIEGELKPYIVFDLLLQMTAPSGGEIFIGDIRRVVYNLRRDRRFKLISVTMDGFESTDSMQQFQKARFETEYLSIDRSKLPYEDLREAIYEDRIEWPPYVVRSRDPMREDFEIAYKEISQLIDEGRKIDHPPNGSKDVADAMAGVCCKLMGDRRFKRSSMDMSQGQRDPQQTHHQRQPHAGVGVLSHPAYRGGLGLSAPVPPNWRN